jgi:hypothetical protein
MPSVSLTNWRTTRRASLDAVEAAHSTVHGTGAGRREATRQINHGYAVLLAAEFQGFCRELHTEAVGHFVVVLPAAVRQIVADEFTFSRQLDRGNANPGSIGSDFGRLGVDWWIAIDAMETEGPNLRKRLESLNAWRNAVAHNDFVPSRLGGTIALTLAAVREWRRVCGQLARAFDAVVANHLTACIGTRPW